MKICNNTIYYALRLSNNILLNYYNVNQTILFTFEIKKANLQTLDLNLI